MIIKDGKRSTDGQSQPTPETEPRPCGHERHKGTCPVCQRIQLERWREQLDCCGRLSDAA
jgi:hypothetical protein